MMLYVLSHLFDAFWELNACTTDPSDCMFKKWAGWGFKSGRIVTRSSLLRICIFCLYIEQEKGVEFQRVW